MDVRMAARRPSGIGSAILIGPLVGAPDTAPAVLVEEAQTTEEATGNEPTCL